MKLSRFLAVAMIAAMAYASQASAAVIDLVSSTVGALGTSNTGSYTLTQEPGTAIWDLISGTLGANSFLDITYDATVGSPYLLDLTTTASGNGELIQATGSSSDILGTTIPQTNSMNALPVVIVAGFEGDPVGTASIMNLSSTPINFSSLFKSAILSVTEGGSTLVSYAVSEVPLPPSVMLFSLGLLTLGGYGMRKKVKSKA